MLITFDWLLPWQLLRHVSKDTAVDIWWLVECLGGIFLWLK